MSRLGRISKLFAAQNASQVISLLTQLLLPPIFLHNYGVTLYGEWLALSAAIGYLATVNYGIQTYTNMQMTIHYNRGEVDECVHLQSGGLFILLIVFLSLTVLLCGIFFIPLDTWLHLQLPLREAQIILYLLSLQIGVGMVFGFFSGNYMVIGSAHRGANFNNLNLLVSTLVMALLAAMRMKLIWLAAAQLAVTVLMTCYLFVDFSRLAPALRPTLRHWRKTSLRNILKPSGHYALLYSSNILGYQLPVIVIQRVLGPAAVVIFSVTRTIYSMGRRLPYLVTNSIGPEVTITYGERNWKKLRQLYELSERVVLLLIPPLSFGVMLFTPLLLALWLRRGSLYDPSVCLLFGITIAIQSVKEHKYQFQFSTNQVRELVLHDSDCIWGDAAVVHSGDVLVRVAGHADCVGAGRGCAVALPTRTQSTAVWTRSHVEFSAGWRSHGLSGCRSGCVHLASLPYCRNESAQAGADRQRGHGDIVRILVLDLWCR